MSLSIPYAFSPTTTIQSSQVNDNFDGIADYINNTACVAGMVTMWAGDIGSIPTGWVLCNGGSGSPDLRDRFIIGAGNTYSIGSTGGSTTKNLAHTHTGPSHTHDFSGTTGFAGSGGNWAAFENGPANRDHTHGFSGTTTNAGTGNTGSGGSATQDIMPPYYGLAFIYKT